MKMLLSFLFLSLAVPLSASSTPFATLSAERMKEMLAASSPVIVDVQPAGEYREHHFEESLRLPRKKTKQRFLHKLGGEKKIIVISSFGGDKAAAAATTLVRYGVAPERIMLLEGGFEGWPSKPTCDCCKSGKQGEKK